MRQVVLYLQSTASEMVKQTCFIMERTRHEFDVVCLWEQPPELFLQYPGLLPFATLSQTPDPAATLRQVAGAVSQIPDPIIQANLTAASAILAGLRLENEIVYRILRRDFMQESTVYQSILTEGEEKKQREIAINFLRQGLPVEVVASGTGLSIEAVQQLRQQLNEPSVE